MQAICCSCTALAPVLLVLTPVIMVLLFFVCLWEPFMEDSGHGYVYYYRQYPYSVIAPHARLEAG